MPVDDFGRFYQVTTWFISPLKSKNNISYLCLGDLHNVSLQNGDINSSSDFDIWVIYYYEYNIDIVYKFSFIDIFESVNLKNIEFKIFKRKTFVWT